MHMTAGEITAVIAGVGTVAGAVFKGLDSLFKTMAANKREDSTEAEKIRREAEAAVKVAEKARYDALMKDFEIVVAERDGLREREHKCEKRLVKAMAWLEHMEAALQNAKINYVPFRPSDHDDDTPSTRDREGTGRTKSNPPIKIPKNRPKRGDEGDA
jgi:hypothetical protein